MHAQSAHLNRLCTAQMRAVCSPISLSIATCEECWPLFLHWLRLTFKELNFLTNVDFKLAACGGNFGHVRGNSDLLMPTSQSLSSMRDVSNARLWNSARDFFASSNSDVKAEIFDSMATVPSARCAAFQLLWGGPGDPRKKAG